MSEVIDKIKKMIGAHSCCAELKAAGQHYLDSVGTPKEAEARAALLKEIDEDIVPIDGLIEFIESPHGAEIFGDAREDFLKKAKEAKAAGGLYCICDACQNAVAVRDLLK